MRSPLHVYDQKYHLIRYTAAGEQTSKVFAEVLFPTDIIVVFRPGMKTPTVFLARSPHGGCLLHWNDNEKKFEDPCYGSRFDSTGKYFFGPALRDLDKLPAVVRDDMIWVEGEIVYGKEYP